MSDFVKKEDLGEIIKAAVAAGIAKFAEKNKPLKRKKYLSIKEFAEEFGMHKASINNLIKEGKIKAFQAYGTTAWRIPYSEKEEYEKKSWKQTKKNIFTRNF